MITNKILKNIRTPYILKAFLAACLVSIYVIAEPALVLHKPEETGGAVILALIVILAFVLIGFLRGLSASGKIRKQIRNLEQSGYLLDRENLVQLNPEFYAGANWLVYACEQEYQFWLFNHIREISQAGEGTSQAKGLMKIRTGTGEDTVIYTKNGTVLYELKKRIMQGN